MQVYALTHQDYDEYTVYGIYSSKEQAEYWGTVLRGAEILRWYDIEEFTLDEPPDLNYDVQPEPYESRMLKPVYDMLKHHQPEYDHKALVDTARELAPLMFKKK